MPAYDVMMYIRYSSDRPTFLLGELRVWQQNSVQNYAKPSTYLTLLLLPSCKPTMPEQNITNLEQQTVPEFMLTLYTDFQESEDVLKKIGVHSTSTLQMACLKQLSLPSLFCCLQLFTSWVRDGVYDFAALPFGVKTHMSNQDKELIQKIPFNWTGREGLQSWAGYNIILIPTYNSGTRGDLLEEIKQMIEVLKHSETDILKTANESGNVRVMAL